MSAAMRRFASGNGSIPVSAEDSPAGCEQPRCSIGVDLNDLDAAHLSLRRCVAHLEALGTPFKSPRSDGKGAATYKDDSDARCYCVCKG